MNKNFLVLLVMPLFFSTAILAEGPIRKGNNTSNEQKLLSKVNEVYENYKQSHPNCGYQPTPAISTYPQQMHTINNPYSHSTDELDAINFEIRDFVLTSTVSDNTDPYCGKLSIKCASYDDYLNASNYHCERVHNGSSSEPVLLEDSRYNDYLAYQAIYNLSAMPKALKDFGLLKQFDALDSFSAYSSSPISSPSYEYNAVVYSTFTYPAPTNPLSPNFNNGNYGSLFLGSTENIKSVCQSIQHQHLSREDAAVRFSQYLGIPPDSPDSIRSFTFLKLRNDPHVAGKADGNMFRPCPEDGNIENPLCSISALVIPHDCKNAPSPYDGTTVSSFLENQFYSAYCKAPANKNSGMPTYYPWTGQGFTYDWYPWRTNSTNVQGSAEYVAATNNGAANIEVVNSKSLENFLLTCEVN